MVTHWYESGGIKGNMCVCGRGANFGSNTRLGKSNLFTMIQVGALENNAKCYYFYCQLIDSIYHSNQYSCEKKLIHCVITDFQLASFVVFFNFTKIITLII